MTDQQQRWDNIRRAVARRMSLLRIPDQATLRRLSGLSQPTAQLYTTKGVGGVPRKQQAQMLAGALQWPDDWYERLSAGESLDDWPIRQRSDVDQRIQFDEALHALGVAISTLEDRADQADELLAQLSARIDALDPRPARPATKRSR